MFRNFASFGFALAALACPAPSAAGADPEGVLAGKELYPSGSMYVLRAEDEVKKAVAAAEAITSPASDRRGTPHYRTKMAGVMLTRALARAKSRARS